MAKINFGGTEENVVTREEFPLAKAQDVLKNETIAIVSFLSTSCAFANGNSSRVTTFSSVPPKLILAILIFHLIYKSF